MADNVPLYQTLLGASATAYIYLAALFHVIDFRVAITISSRPRYPTVPLTSLSLHQSECSGDFSLSLIYILSYKIQCSKPRALVCQVHERNGSTPGATWGLRRQGIVSLILVSSWPPGGLCLGPGLHTPLRTSLLTRGDNTTFTHVAWAHP